jgi:membrane protein insertase Oxa1/YidC/SpoIIIJ
MFLKLLRKKDTCAYKQGWDFEVIFVAGGGGGGERERERIRTMMKIFIFLFFVFVFVNFFNCFLLYLFTSLLSFTIFQTSIIISFFFPERLVVSQQLKKRRKMEDKG